MIVPERVVAGLRLVFPCKNAAFPSSLYLLTSRLICQRDKSSFNSARSFVIWLLETALMTLYFSSSNIFNMTPNPVTPIYTDKNNLYSGHNHLLMTKTLSFINDTIVLLRNSSCKYIML